MQTFPSDEEFRKMSRKDRIALMEQEAFGNQDQADFRESSRGRLAQSQPPRRHLDPEVDEPAGSTDGFRVRGAQDGVARRRARGSGNSDPEASQGARRPPAHCLRPTQEISDEAFATMSRKERIALLEREAGSSDKGDMRTASPKLPPIEQPSPRCNPHARGAAKASSLGPRGGTVDHGDDQSLGDGEDAAFEERRRLRRMRLQQRQRSDASTKLQHCDEVVDPVDDLKQTVHDRNQSHRGDTLQARETPAQKVDRRQASTGSSAQPPTGKLPKPLIDEIEAMAIGSDSSGQWHGLCADLATIAHRLQPGDVLRAIKALSACADAGWLSDTDAAAMLGAVEALLACVTNLLGSLDSSLIADFLHVMAVSKVAEQTYLDMMLAQLLVVLRRSDGTATPEVLSILAGSIATLHSKGLSAKKGGSGASSSANKRCMDTLNQRIGDALVDFGENEFARIGGAYLVVFLEDSQRRAYLARAAELEVGLRPDSHKCLMAMKAVEVAVRQHSFAFIATLADASKDYLAKLKAADA